MRLRRMLLGAALLTACAGGGGRPMVLARGTLAYAVAPAADARVVTIELSERFELVVRTVRGATVREQRRIDLGPPEADLVALAITLDGNEAVVGGRDGWLRAIGLADGIERARWPHGAAITAIATSSDAIVVGDAAGTMCVRGLADGRLRVCVDAAAPVMALSLSLSIDGATVLADGPRRWRLRDLAMLPADTPARPPWVVDGTHVRWHDAAGDHDVAMHGQVRAVTAGPAGTLLIAAWVTALDQPSVVVAAITPP